MIKHTLGAVALALLFMQSAYAQQSIPDGLSIDTDYSENESGYYYINVPHLPYGSAYTTLDLSQSGIHSFKVYNEEGKNIKSQAHLNDDANLLVIAPDGYILHLTGTVTSARHTSTYLQFYDGETTENRYPYRYSFGSKNGEDVGLLYTTGNKMLLSYHTFITGGMLDLTVTLVKASDEHIITANGNVTASPTSPAAKEVVLTATPEQGYLPNGFLVTDAEGHSISAEGGWYSSNTGSFMMPGTDVTVTPEMTNKLSAEDGGLYVTIPYFSASESAAKVANIPDGIETFKVYEYTYRADGVYDNHSNGFLLLNAPSGKILELSGAVQSQTIYDGLSVYDGNTTAKQLGKKRRYGASTAEGETLDVIRSSGNQMLIQMYTQSGDDEYWGVNLTVRVIDPSVKHGIEVKSAEHGSVTASLAEAGASEVVSLTITPESGYYLNELIIKDEAGVDVTCSGGLWYEKDKTAHFQMATSKVTVTPVFETKENLHVMMPFDATQSAPFTPVIPAGVSHFKVYNDNTPSFMTYMLIKAPFGTVAHLTGSADIKKDNSSNYIRVNNGQPYETSNNLRYYYANQSVDYLATGKYLTVYYTNRTATIGNGLDLTVEFVPEEQIPLSLSSVSLGNKSYARVFATTFYLESSAVELPEGCLAFTLNSDYSMSLVGDGRIVPAACPVIVVANQSSVSAKRTSKTATPKAGNILIGAPADTIVENVYVLNVKAGSGIALVINKYNGNIPSGKAYIIK